MRKLQLGLQMDKEHETDWWATAKNGHSGRPLPFRLTGAHSQIDREVAPLFTI